MIQGATLGTPAPASHEAVASPMRPPSLLMVGNFLSASGVRSVSEALATRLKRRGWRVVTTSSRSGRLARVTDMLLTIWSERNRFDVALIDVYSGLAFLWAVTVCRFLRLVGKPYVLTLHGGNLPALARRQPRAVRRLLNSAVHVTAPSPYLAEAMKPYYPQLTLQPNPIDFSAWDGQHRRKAEPRLIWVRAFHRVYNPVLAVEVLARVIEVFPTASLTMLGSDRGDGTLRSVHERAAALGVDQQVRVPGYVSPAEVSRSLARADIFLNTSRIDNAPVSILEAMAAGLCIVSTDVGGLPDLIEHGREALLVRPDDTEAMVAGVQRLLTDPELAARLSANAHSRAATFDWSAVLPRWEQILREAAGKQWVEAGSGHA